MNKFFQSVKSFFIHHRAERSGLLLLLLILLVVLLFPLFWNKKNSSTLPLPEQVINFEQSLTIADSVEKTVALEPSLFRFDPNTADSVTYRKLGFSAAQTSSILKYRNKGGVFRHVSDFAKLYVVSSADYDRLQPYIVIDEKYKKPKPIKVELNSADSLALETLRGIGPYYAGKILKYRARLGGFVRVEQLLEIKGIDEDRLALFNEQLKLDTSLVQKIPLNTVTMDELKSHPYILTALAKKIIKYRDKKGGIPIDSVDELIEANVLTPVQATELNPYLKF